MTLKKIFKHIKNNFFVYGLGALIIGCYILPTYEPYAYLIIGIVMIIALIVVGENMANEYKSAIVKLKEKEIKEKLDKEKWLV